MASFRAPAAGQASALKAEFEQELGRLASCANRRGALQGVMRLRALSDIASALSTEALLELAVAVSVTRRGQGRDNAELSA